MKGIISQVIESKLEKKKYNAKEAPHLTKEICNEIQNQVKGMLPIFQYLNNLTLLQQ